MASSERHDLIPLAGE